MPLSQGLHFAWRPATRLYIMIAQRYRIVVDGHKVHITRNLCICDNTYTLGITDEYAKILGYKIMEAV